MGYRILEWCLAAILCVVTLPLMILACLVIRWDSSGPAVYRQTRVGKGQRPFTMYKLRTMKTDTTDRASHEVSDQQITGIGRTLRRTKLDELPQLFNILKGEMAFVGPRPCLPVQSELIAARAARGVFDVRPGITGPAQLAGIDMSRIEALAEADAAYIAHRSVAEDLRLIAQTAVGGGRGDAVVR